jgi:hypothetical protein
MSERISLREADRRVFLAAYNDGLWDIMLGCVFLMLAIAPFLSTSLGDFWSSAVFLPFWGLVWLAIRLLRKRVVRPRVGVVQFGRARKIKLARFTAVMLVLNVVALVLGIVAALSFGSVPGQVFSISLGMILLVGFSVAAYLLGFSRLYFYGLLVGLSPLLGEWLWNRGVVTHHGFPVTFGATAGIMILVGLAVFVRLVRNNPLSTEGIPSEGV